MSHDFFIVTQEHEVKRTPTVNAANPSRPLVETLEGRQGKEETRFTTFEPMAPPSTVFEVPTSCKTPPPCHHA